MKLVSWNTTKKCNLYCDHCYRDAGLNRSCTNELSTLEAKKLISDVKRSGFQLMILSGGEPLLRPDLFELARYGTDLGLIMALGTNGTLITKENISNIIESGIQSVAISIDSTNPAVHNDFRKREFAWEDALRGIKIARENGVSVQINVTISKVNQHEIDELLKFCETLGAKSVHVLFLVETGRGKQLSHLYLTKEEYRRAIEKTLSFSSPMFIKPTCAPQAVVMAEEMGKNIRTKRGCIAGISYCSVLSDGTVDICPYADVHVGNIRESSFYDLWNDSPIFQQLRDYENLKGSCRHCKHQDTCGGCRARAFSKKGDFLAFDEYCLL